MGNQIRRGQFCGRTRRETLWQTGAGFTGVALSAVLETDGFFNSAATADEQFSDQSGRIPDLPPGVKSCIFLYMYGGPSQMDTFDYKPELQKRHGMSIELEMRRREIRHGRLLASQRKFRQYGESGQWCSDAFPNIARHMDKLTVIKSLYSDSFAHGSANLQMNTGRILQGHPSLGAWLSYGLGTLNKNLPSFVVMLDPRGGPIPGAPNWSAGYMPASHQGTVLRSGSQPMLNLRSASDATKPMRRQQLDVLHALNREHLADRSRNSDLRSRIASYELAFQLQSSAPAALDVSEETATTQDLYGLRDPKPSHRISVGPAVFGRQCLMARRLVERGVRFIQIYSGGGHQQQNWDAHNGVEENLQIHAPEVDKPISGLLADLEQRGLLDETLVIWGGEFGRQSVVQGDHDGREHNPKGFTYWLAGGGVKAGKSYGATDEIGHAAVENPHHIRDLHATILQLMGLDHRHLTFFYGGTDQRLTGVAPAAPIDGVIG